MVCHTKDSHHIAATADGARDALSCPKSCHAATMRDRLDTQMPRADTKVTYAKFREPSAADQPYSALALALALAGGASTSMSSSIAKLFVATPAKRAGAFVRM